MPDITPTPTELIKEAERQFLVADDPTIPPPSRSQLWSPESPRCRQSQGSNRSSATSIRSSIASTWTNEALYSMEDNLPTSRQVEASKLSKQSNHVKKSEPGKGSFNSKSTIFEHGSFTNLPLFDQNNTSRFSWQLSNTDRARSWFTRWFVEWWLLELLSWVVSAACMLVISVVLWHFDGKGLPKWSMQISMNSFISILSGFAKSALLLPTAEAVSILPYTSLNYN
jgi:hypothetical protein